MIKDEKRTATAIKICCYKNCSFKNETNGDDEKEETKKKKKKKRNN